VKLIEITAAVVLAATAASAFAEQPRPAGVTQADETAIRSIVADLEADAPNPHVSAKLDWENAFGIRYFDLKKRDAFYGAVVKPQFKTATATTLETRVQFVTPSVAVTDTYWHVVGQVYAGETKPGPDRWGRTTYIFEKDNGAWTEVIERVADLRLPYYKHLDAMPVAAAIPPSTLSAYAGHYKGSSRDADVAVTGDHLTITTKRGPLIAIPQSQTDFLVFFGPDDTAEYYKVRFSAKDGVTRFTLSEAWGEKLGVLEKQP